jgi:hypothetical protein
MDDDNSLHEKPAEFFTQLSASPGYCDAQSILPIDEDRSYVCHCTCGRWDTTAPSRERGLEMAREHTAATA